MGFAWHAVAAQANVALEEEDAASRARASSPGSPYFRCASAATGQSIRWCEHLPEASASSTAPSLSICARSILASSQSKPSSESHNVNAMAGREVANASQDSCCRWVDTQVHALAPMLPLPALQQMIEEERRTPTPTPHSLADKALQKSEALLADLLALGLANEEEDERSPSPRRSRSMIRSNPLSTCSSPEVSHKIQWSDIEALTWIAQKCMNCYSKSVDAAPFRQVPALADKACQTDVAEPEPEAGIFSSASSAIEEKVSKRHSMSQAMSSNSLPASPSSEARDLRRNLLQRSHSELIKFPCFVHPQPRFQVMHQPPVAKCIISISSSLPRDVEMLSIKLRRRGECYRALVC